MPVSPLLGKSARSAVAHPSTVTATATASHGKAKAKVDESSISRLPPELLAHVFSLLPAGSLLAATLVSKAWSHVATDEASWRSAFANYYGLPEDGNVPGRRLEAASWRAEYLLRTRLIRRWLKSRSAPLTYDAHAGGPVTDLVVSLTDAMSVSAPGASASRTDPQTSRILRTGIHAGAAPGQVTAARANERGQAIAWGLRDGDVRISLVCAPVSRPLSLANLGTDASKHHGPVTALAFAPFPSAPPPARTTFASTATDGLVKVWDTECSPSAACLFSSSPHERMRRPEGDMDVGLSLAYAPSQRTVVVGTEGGALHAWRLDGQWSSRACVRVAPTKEADKVPIVAVYLDTAAMTTHAEYSVLVRRMGAAAFERHWPFVEGRREARTYAMEAGGPISALAVDFASSRNIAGFGSHKYVVTGDEEGVVALYLWDSPSTRVAPCKFLQKRASTNASVTTLAVSDLLVFVGRCSASLLVVPQAVDLGLAQHRRHRKGLRHAHRHPRPRHRRSIGPATRRPRPRRRSRYARGARALRRRPHPGHSRRCRCRRRRAGHRLACRRVQDQGQECVSFDPVLPAIG
jgi:hypothetical protein